MEPENIQDDAQSADQISDAEMTAAKRSLADALRVSFGLLSALMILVVLAFIFSGWKQIDTTERGVKLLFGRIVGHGDRRVVQPGLRFSWPEPIGQILTISTRQEELGIKEFWMFVPPEEADLLLAERDPPTEGLRPGWDGALLTGDRSLVHVKLTCNYALGTHGGSTDPARVLNYVNNVADAEKLIEAAVCNAAVRAAAKRTAEFIYLSEREAFQKEVAQLAQQRLDEIKSGIEIQSVLLDRRTVPLAAIEAFDDVKKAMEDWESMVNDAKTEAATILNGAAGNAWALLTGDPEKAAKAGHIEKADRPEIFHSYLRARRADDEKKMLAQREKISRFGLLDLYADAREDNQQQLADEVLAEIDEVLTGNRIGGAAAGMISHARAYRSSVQQKVAGDVAEFKRLVGQFKASPELMMQRLWVDVKTEILNSPTVEKHYLTPTQKVVIRVSRDPEAKRRAIREAIKVRQQQEAQEE